MTTLSWPATRHFRPMSMQWGVRAPKSTWSALYTGQVQSVSHLGARLRLAITLPPCRAADAAEREAFLFQLHARGDWVALPYFLRTRPLGTLAGAPTVQANAAAGATSFSIQTTAGATLLAGDVLKANGQMIVVGYGGMTANGSGVGTVPCAIPLRIALTAAQAVTWSEPTATFQLNADEAGVNYRAPALQQSVDLDFTEVFA